MKLFKDDHPYISKRKWMQILLATSIMVLTLYAVAMVFSLCGSTYFILDYQNAQMDKIEAFLTEHKVMPMLNYLFSTLEFFIVCSFVLKKRTRIWYVLSFYGIRVTLAFLVRLPSVFNTLYALLFYIVVVVIEQFITNKKFLWKQFGFQMIRLAVGIAVTLILQAMILVIKAGYFDGVNHIQPLSSAFIYAIEYDIALSVILVTVSLYIDKGKGDNEEWTTYHNPGGSSQMSNQPSLKSNTKNLTKTQKNKIRWFYIKLYVIQLGTFLLVMVLPFLLGKVFEFLVMYLAFCVTRTILGFKYSLHYKKESLCVTVGVIVFGILSLVVPFFYVVLIIAVSLGVGLAVFLHLSYKYKGFYLFTRRAKPDKFAELCVIFDDDLSRKHVKSICVHRGLTNQEANLIADFAEGNNKSYLAKKYNYSEKTIERTINDCIDRLKLKD